MAIASTAPTAPDTGKLIHDCTRDDGTVDIVKLIASIASASYRYGVDDAVFMMERTLAALPTDTVLCPAQLSHLLAMTRD